MSFVIAAPEVMTSAATDLATIGSNVEAAHLVAAARTTAVIPAAADEVSAAIAQLFSRHAANYKALAGQAAAFQAQFTQNLTAGAFSYASAEEAAAGFLQNLALNIAGGLFVVGVGTLLVLLYVSEAYQDLVTTGHLLTWGEFIAQLQANFMMAFGGYFNMYPGQPGPF